MSDASDQPYPQQGPSPEQAGPEPGRGAPPAYPGAYQQHPYPQPSPGYPPQAGGYPPAPYGQPAQYPPPYYGPGYYPAQARRTNGLAIASMVLGILWVYWIGSILALVFGYVARKQIREANQSGDGMAIAGIVLGWVGVGVLSLIVVLAVVGAATGA